MSGLQAYLIGETRGAALLRIVLSIVLVLLAWQVLASYVVTNKLLLVPPAEVLQAFLKEVRTGAMETNAVATIVALALAFPFAVVLGVASGLALASSRLLLLTAGPMLTAFYSLPIVALAPLFIAGLGLGFASKFVLVALVVIFPVLVTTETGLRTTDAHLIEAARSFNATRLQIFSTVTLPFAVPFIVSGIRVAWARALVGVVVAEFFGAFAGLGFAINAAGQTFDTARLLAYVIVLGVLGLIGSLFFEWLERRLAPWRHA